MLGIHARYVPWTTTNITRVDAKREFSIYDHYMVKGQTNAFYTKYLRKMQYGMCSLNNCISFNTGATVLLTKHDSETSCTL